MNHNRHPYRERRLALLKQMRAQSGGGIALVPTAPEAPRNRDSFYPYRHDSYAFYYLSGFPEPEAVIALVAGAEGDAQILFCRDKDPEREIWDGFRYGPDAAREIFGFDAAHALGDMEAMLRLDLASDQPALYYAAWVSLRRGISASPVLLNEVRGRARTGVAAPEEIVDVRQPLDALRLTKDAHELALMRRAAAISSAAHRRAMGETRVGWFEYQVEAELIHEFLHHGAQAGCLPVDRRRRP